LPDDPITDGRDDDADGLARCAPTARERRAPSASRDGAVARGGARRDSISAATRGARTGPRRSRGSSAARQATSRSRHRNRPTAIRASAPGRASRDSTISAAEPALSRCEASREAGPSRRGNSRGRDPRRCQCNIVLTGSRAGFGRSSAFITVPRGPSLSRRLGPHPQALSLARSRSLGSRLSRLCLRLRQAEVDPELRRRVRLRRSHWFARLSARQRLCQDQLPPTYASGFDEVSIMAACFHQLLNPKICQSSS